jgi:hypothetical protein
VKKMIVAMLMSVAACGGAVDPAPEPVKVERESVPASALHVQAVDCTAHYGGRQGSCATWCPTGSELLTAACRVKGGEVTTSALYGANGWWCEASIADSAKGMDLTVHLVCTEPTP